LIREIFTDENGMLLKEGDLMFRPRMAQSLDVISREGGNALYTGSLAPLLIQDIEEFGGIITMEDLALFE
jgi:gamma-glutamyltranspeptidase